MTIVWRLGVLRSALTDGASASEKGISRVLFSMKDGGTRTYYSRFHTISRKEGGAWRVLTEYFPAATDDVGEEAFSRARALDDVAEFRCYTPYPDKQCAVGASNEPETVPLAIARTDSVQ